MTDERTTVNDEEALAALERANPVATGARDEGRAVRIYAAALAGGHGASGRGRRPVMAIAGAVAGFAIVAIVAGAFALNSSGGGSNGGSIPAGNDANAVSADVDGGPAMMCAFLYSPETLAERGYAFAGTLTSIGETSTDAGYAAANGSVTFHVDEWFHGGEGDTVTLEGSGMPVGYGSEDESNVLKEGGHYLVSGDAPYIWSCGFTKTYSTAMANEWREAFGK